VDLTADDPRHAIRRLQRELDKKEKALTKAATMLMLSKEVQPDFSVGRGALIQAADREAIVTLLQEGINHGASAKSDANLFGLATRTLRRWGLMIRAQGFSCDQRKEATRHVEEGVYVGSESTIYRFMRQEGLLNHRRRKQSLPESKKPRPQAVWLIRPGEADRPHTRTSAGSSILCIKSGSR
jgi:hypothetical protein